MKGLLLLFYCVSIFHLALSQDFVYPNVKVFTPEMGVTIWQTTQSWKTVIDTLENGIYDILLPGKFTRPAERQLTLWQSYFDSWDHFGFGRSIQTEEVTCDYFNATVAVLADKVESELATSLLELKRQLERAAISIQSDEDYINELPNKLDKLVIKETKEFKICLAKTVSDLAITKKILRDKSDSYQFLKGMTLEKAKKCAIIYPSRNQDSDRKRCFKDNGDRFQNSAKALLKTFDGNCMNRFLDVGACITETTERFVADVNRKLSNSMSCGNGSVATLTLETDIPKQVESAREKFEGLNSIIEQEMSFYHQTERQFLDNFESQPRSVEAIRNHIQYDVLSPWNNAILSTVYDIEDQTECATEAKKTFGDIVDKATNAYYQSNLKLLKDTIQQMTKARADLDTINEKLPSYGNAAITKCVADSYLFVSNSVFECYDLTFRRFMLEHNKTLSEIERNVNSLINYNIKYLSTKDPIPPNEWFVKLIKLEADAVLKEYKECIYEMTGRNYDVTTMGYHTTPYIQLRHRSTTLKVTTDEDL